VLCISVRLDKSKVQDSEGEDSDSEEVVRNYSPSEGDSDSDPAWRPTENIRGIDRVRFHCVLTSYGLDITYGIYYLYYRHINRKCSLF